MGSANNKLALTQNTTIPIRRQMSPQANPPKLRLIVRHRFAFHDTVYIGVPDKLLEAVISTPYDEWSCGPSE